MIVLVQERQNEFPLRKKKSEKKRRSGLVREEMKVDSVMIEEVRFYLGFVKGPGKA